MNNIDIVVPIYNEGERIINFLKNCEKNLDISIRFLICYDIEDDITLPFLKNTNEIKSPILLVKNPNRGPCSAVIEGIKNCKAEIIMTIPADENLEYNFLKTMLNHINDGNDLVIPSRFIKGGRMIGAPKLKKIIAVVGSFLISNFALIPIRDATNCFKMFRKSMIENINLTSEVGFLYAFEIAIKAYLKDYKIIELPYTWKMDTEKKSNFKTLEWLPSYINFLFFSFKSNLKKKFFK
tara:strand:- start:64 stop:777 length:714 start_codon:yes stop_codon:yes gene_type:complete